MPRRVSDPAFINHPELRDDEVFLANLTSPEEVDYSSPWNSPSGLARFPWLTRRIGDNAISGMGGPVPDHKPIFCLKLELINFGINPDSIWG